MLAQCYYLYYCYLFCHNDYYHIIIIIISWSAGVMPATFFLKQSFFGGFSKKMIMLWEHNSYIIPFTDGYELQNSARDSPLLTHSPWSSLIQASRSTAALLHEFAWGAGERAWEKPQSSSQLVLPLVKKRLRNGKLISYTLVSDGKLWWLLGGCFSGTGGWWCAEMIHCGLLWGQSRTPAVRECEPASRNL